MNIKVSLLDNDEDFLIIYKEELEKHFEVFATTSTKDFIDSITGDPIIPISDWNLDQTTALDIYRIVKKEYPLLHFIFITTKMTRTMLTEVINEGWGCYVLDKDHPEFLPDLIHKIHQAKECLNKKMYASRDAVLKDERVRKEMTNTLDALNKLDGRGN